MKNKIASILIVFISLTLFYSCGKKDDTKTSSEKDTKNESNKDDSPSFDKPIRVEFKIAGSVIGTLNAIYYQKKARSQSTYEVRGQKISATGYFDGGDYMYMVTEIAGKKMGMKIKKGEYGNKEDQIDALTFKDKLKEMDKIGTEEVIGRKCDIYKTKDGKTQMSIYNEMIPLKISTGEGKMVMEATKLDTDVKVDDKTFDPPSDVDYMDAGEMMKNLKGVDPKKMENMKDKAKEMEEMMKKYKK
jgi:hypothetical protein